MEYEGNRYCFSYLIVREVAPSHFLRKVFISLTTPGLLPSEFYLFRPKKETLTDELYDGDEEGEKKLPT